MLAQKDLPPYLVSGLKAVSSLLLPANQVNNFFFSSSQFDFLGSLPRVLETPYIGADANLVRVESVGQRRQSPIVVTWSTTTSATGLPTVEPEPSRARSSSYWKHVRRNRGFSPFAFSERELCRGTQPTKTKARRSRPSHQDQALNWTRIRSRYVDSLLGLDQCS